MESKLALLQIQKEKGISPPIELEPGTPVRPNVSKKRSCQLTAPIHSPAWSASKRGVSGSVMKYMQRIRRTILISVDFFFSS